MLLSTLTHFFLEGRSLWLLLLVVNHQHYRSLVCVCVSSSYRLFVNSSCTHIHTYKKQNWFFSLSPSLLLSFVFLFFLFISLFVLDVYDSSWECFFPIVLPCPSSSIFELSYWKFSICLILHSDMTRSFAWLHRMPLSFSYRHSFSILTPEIKERIEKHKDKSLTAVIVIVSRCFRRRRIFSPADYSIEITLSSFFVKPCNRYYRHQRKQQKYCGHLSRETNYCSMTLLPLFFLRHY